MVGYIVEQGVAFLQVAQPPLNGLSRAVRAGLMEAIDRAEEDETAAAIALIGAGGHFPVGPELAEYDRGLAEPTLRDLCERVSFSEKPVVAAMAGRVSGGGFELALAAHYRLAHQSTRFDFSDIHIGLTPAGGGSQRLPRLVGAAQALDMLMTGRSVTIQSAQGQRLADTVTDGDLHAATLAFCARLASEGAGPRPLSAVMPGGNDPVAYQDQIADCRAAFKGGPDSPQAQIVTLVEAAALLPFEAGLDLETEVFQDCLASPRSHALRHGVQAEHRAARFDLRPQVMASLPDLDKVAVLGAGALGIQIVVSALNAGVTVFWAGQDEDSLIHSMGQVSAVFDKAAQGGGLPREVAERRLSRLTTGAPGPIAQAAQLVIVAAQGFEEAIKGASAPVAVAHPAPTSGLGMRFAAPVFSKRLVEVLQGSEASEAGVALARAFALRLGKVPVHVSGAGVSLAGRLSGALHRAADALVDQGASPYEVDRALINWGLPMGPFEMRDRKGLADMARSTRVQGCNWSALLAEAGRGGRAQGAGFYDWSEGAAMPSEAAAQLIDARRAPSAVIEIPMLIWGAVAAEGLRLLDEGRAKRASDIDVVSLLALDLPRESGGVMNTISQQGLFKVQSAMARLGHGDRAFWTVPPRWSDLVKNGQCFDDL